MEGGGRARQAVEAGGRAAREGSGTVDLFLAPLFAQRFFLSVGHQANAKYLKYFAFLHMGEAGGARPGKAVEAGGRAAREGSGTVDLFF